MQTTQTTVTGDMTIGDVIEKYPTAAEVMQSYGLQCVGCSVNTMESVEMGAKGHGMSDDEITDMINEINSLLSKQEPKEEVDVSNATLNVTEMAANKINELKGNEEEKTLKIAVVRGGCSGHMYQLEFVDKKEDDDVVIEQHGTKLFVDKESLAMLNGTTVDYVDALQGAGFKFSNPNETAGCGCGKSFK